MIAFKKLHKIIRCTRSYATTLSATARMKAPRCLPVSTMDRSAVSRLLLVNQLGRAHILTESLPMSIPRLARICNSESVCVSLYKCSICVAERSTHLSLFAETCCLADLRHPELKVVDVLPVDMLPV